MDAIRLGNRLRAARKARDLSQQDAAEALGVPRTAITQMESGKRSVSTLELTKLAELYRHPIGYFFHDRDEAEEEDVLVALHRIEPGLEQDAAVWTQVDRCLSLCREGVTLESLLDMGARTGPPAYKLPLPRSVGEAVTQGARVAVEERRRLDIGDAPIADVSELISAQGIWASALVLPDHMSGLFLCHSSIGMAILVNARHVRSRKRFSYAHEYAHSLLDRDRSFTVSSVDNAGDFLETRANAFAATFLMPKGGVFSVLNGLGKGGPSRREQTVFSVATDQGVETESRAAAGSQRITYKDVALLAHHFGVSYRAAFYRLKNLGYLSHRREASELLAQEESGRSYLNALSMLSDLDEPEQEKYWDRELRNEIAHLAIEAYRREKLSRGRVLELSKKLGIEGQTLLDLAEAARM